MSKRGETAIIPYLSNLITRGFNLARKVEAQNMKVGRALGHEYAESIAEDMANTGEIENEVVRFEALIDLLILISNQAKANADELLGAESWLTQSPYPTTNFIYVTSIPKNKFKLCPNCGNKEIYLGYLDIEEEPAIVCEECDSYFKFYTSPTTARNHDE